jgi:hypothetical protein
MKKKTTSWGWIIFWLIVFWPVGLILIIKKLSEDKSAIMSGKSGAASVVGWILTAIGALFLLSGLSASEGSVIVLALFFLAGGILLLRKAQGNKKTAAIYKKYIDIIVNNGESSIDNIAGAVGLGYDKVAADLQKMIDIGYLKNAYINVSTREIIIPRSVPSPELVPQAAGSNAAPVAQKLVIRCPACGANATVVSGSVTECEYCGSPLSA